MMTATKHQTFTQVERNMTRNNIALTLTTGWISATCLSKLYPFNGYKSDSITIILISNNDDTGQSNLAIDGIAAKQYSGDV